MPIRCVCSKVPRAPGVGCTCAVCHRALMDAGVEAVASRGPCSAFSSCGILSFSGSLGPFAQHIGRALRRVPESPCNTAYIISHPLLHLRPLWEGVFLWMLDVHVAFLARHRRWPSMCSQQRCGWQTQETAAMKEVKRTQILWTHNCPQILRTTALAGCIEPSVHVFWTGTGGAGTCLTISMMQSEHGVA